MPRITNEHLANLIGGVDDNVVKLGGEVIALTTRVGHLEETVKAANGLQRMDHDKLLNVAKAQETCPARVAHDKKDNNDNPDNPYGLAKWGIRQYGVFGLQAFVIVGLFALLLRANGFI